MLSSLIHLLFFPSFNRHQPLFTIFDRPSSWKSWPCKHNLNTYCDQWEGAHTAFKRSHAWWMWQRSMCRISSRQHTQWHCTSENTIQERSEKNQPLLHKPSHIWTQGLSSECWCWPQRWWWWQRWTRRPLCHRGGTYNFIVYLGLGQLRTGFAFSSFPLIRMTMKAGLKWYRSHLIIDLKTVQAYRDTQLPNMPFLSAINVYSVPFSITMYKLIDRHAKKSLSFFFIALLCFVTRRSSFCFSFSNEHVWTSIDCIPKNALLGLLKKTFSSW